MDKAKETPSWEEALSLEARRERDWDEEFAKAAKEGLQELQAAFGRARFPRAPLRLWSALAKADRPEMLAWLMEAPEAAPFRSWAGGNFGKNGERVLAGLTAGLAREKAFRCLWGAWREIGERDRAFAARSALESFGNAAWDWESKSESLARILHEAGNQGFWAPEDLPGERASGELAAGCAGALGAGGEIAEAARRCAKEIARARPEIFLGIAASAYRTMVKPGGGKRYIEAAALDLLWENLEPMVARDCAGRLRGMGAPHPRKISPLWEMALWMRPERFEGLVERISRGKETSMPKWAFAESEENPGGILEKALEHCERAGKPLPKLLVTAAGRAEKIAGAALEAAPGLKRAIEPLLEQATRDAREGALPDREAVRALKQACASARISPLTAWLLNTGFQHGPIETVARNARRLGFDPGEGIRMAQESGIAIGKDARAELIRLESEMIRESAPESGAPRAPRRGI